MLAEIEGFERLKWEEKQSERERAAWARYERQKAVRERFEKSWVGAGVLGLGRLLGRGRGTVRFDSAVPAQDAGAEKEPVGRTAETRKAKSKKRVVGLCGGCAKVVPGAIYQLKDDDKPAWTADSLEMPPHVPMCSVATEYDRFERYGRDHQTPFFQLSSMSCAAPSTTPPSGRGTSASSFEAAQIPGDDIDIPDNLPDNSDEIRPAELELDYQSLDPRLNECLLFHGTNPVSAEAITVENFKVSLAGSASGTLFGRGIYFAENCTKSDEYAKPDPQTNYSTMLLCRTLLGRFKVFDDHSFSPRDCENCVLGLDPPHAFHSLLGDRLKAANTFREFVVFDDDQAYVEFVVWYERVAK